jgi:hypothetical protein
MRSKAAIALSGLAAAVVLAVGIWTTWPQQEAETADPCGFVRAYLEPFLKQNPGREVRVIRHVERWYATCHARGSGRAPP